MSTPSKPVDALAEVIWTASRADESTISAIGAQHVARAVVAAGYRLVLEDDEDTVRVAARNLIEVYDDTAPDWYPAAIDDLREALDGTR